MPCYAMLKADHAVLGCARLCCAMLGSARHARFMLGAARWGYAGLCYAMPCYAMLRQAMLGSAMLGYAMLQAMMTLATLGQATLYGAAPCAARKPNATPQYARLCYAMPRYAMLRYAMLLRRSVLPLAPRGARRCSTAAHAPQWAMVALAPGWARMPCRAPSPPRGRRSQETTPRHSKRRRRGRLCCQEGAIPVPQRLLLRLLSLVLVWLRRSTRLG
jgi:hypothetical protein